MQSKTLLSVSAAIVVLMAIVSGSLGIFPRAARQQISDLPNQQIQETLSIPGSTWVPTPVPSPANAASIAAAVAVQLSEPRPGPPLFSLPIDARNAMLRSLTGDPPGMPTLDQVVLGGNIQKRRVDALERFYSGNTEERRVDALAKSDRIATAAVAEWNGAMRLSPDQMQALNAITVGELRREAEVSLEIMSRLGSMDLASASQLRVETVTRQHDTLIRILEKATPLLTPEQRNMMRNMFELWAYTRMARVRVEEKIALSGY